MSENIEKVESKEAAKSAKSAPKKDKVKFTSRIRKYGREFKAEFKKIVWPSKKTIVRNTVVVLAAIAIMGAIVFLFDLGLTRLLHLFIR